MSRKSIFPRYLLGGRGSAKCLSSDRIRFPNSTKMGSKTFLFSNELNVTYIYCTYVSVHWQALERNSGNITCLLDSLHYLFDTIKPRLYRQKE